jgi:glycosyltransferase involved in cell wall biosynthesis
MAKISVIIPTYNRAGFLRTAIISVLNQTFQDFEIIVVDDASTDNTPEVVTHFGDERIKYMRNNTSKGAAGSRNVAIMSSTCTYIAFLDDDDEWLPKKLQMQTSILEKSPMDIAGVHTRIIQIEKVSGKIFSQEIFKKNSEDIFQGNYITTSSVLLRRSCFERVGLFDENMPTSNDYDMWIRISKKFRFEYIDEPLVKYYIHEARLTDNYDKKIKGMEILLKKYGEMFSLNSKHYSDQYFHIGVFYCYNGDVRKGRKAYLKAIWLYPYKLQYYFNFCLSLTGANNFKKLKKTKEKIISFLEERLMQVDKEKN